MGNKLVRNGLIIAASATAAALVVGGLVWTEKSAEARSNVELLINPDAIKCENSADATTLAWPLGDRDEIVYNVPALNLNSGFDCTFSMIIRNTGNTQVSLKKLVLNGLGEANANGANAPRLTLNNIQRIQDDSVDANFAMDFPLGAGQSMELSAVLEPNQGCVSEGGRIGLERTPKITVTALGLSGIIKPMGPTFAMLGTKDSSCDD